MQIISIDYPRKSEILKELKNMGHTQMSKQEEVADEVRRAVKKEDKDESSPEVEYQSSVYDEKQLRDLDRPKNSK